MEMEMENVNIKKIVGLSFAGIVGLFVLLGSWTIVSPGEKGIVIRLGSVSRVLDEGFNFKLPLVETVKKVDVRVQKSEVGAEAASKDLQNVSAVIALNYQLDGKSVGSLYQQVGLDYEAKIIAPSLQESVKSATAGYTAEELITKREMVKAEMKKNLTERLSKHNISVTEVNIVNFDFSKSFNAAIEAKVTAEQEALASKNKLEQIKYEAEQRIVQSKAEAEAIRIQADALKENKGLIELEAVKKWNGILPQYMTGVTPFVNLQK